MNPPVVDRYLEELLNDAPAHEASPAAAAAQTRPSEPPPMPIHTPAPLIPFPPRAPVAMPAEDAVPATALDEARARMERIASARALATPGRWLRVCIGSDRYAVELLRVQEVVRVSPLVAMRGADMSVLGVMNLRGRIVPVFDLGLWLGGAAVIADERSRVVVVERDDELIGLLVTAVSDVATLGEDNIEPPVSAGAPGAIVGVARVGDAPTVLLDANALFE